MGDDADAPDDAHFLLAGTADVPLASSLILLYMGLSSADGLYPPYAGQDKRAKFPTSKAPFSAGFHSFRLIFGRAIISRNGLEA